LAGLIFISYIIKACIVFKNQISEFVYYGARSVIRVLLKLAFY
jgi:hypothetical protein